MPSDVLAAAGTYVYITEALVCQERESEGHCVLVDKLASIGAAGLIIRHREACW